MKFLSVLYVLVLAISISACVAGGPAGNDVVRVTTVAEVGYAGLKAEELDTIRKFRHEAFLNESGPAEADKVDTRATRNFSAEEYLRQYPELVRLGGFDYRVGGNDILNITIFDEENLSRQGIRVSGDGNITFPLIGRLHLDGLTTSEIEDLIAQKLAEGQYLLDAQVSVTIAKYGSKRYKVLGAIKRPGIFPLAAEEQLLDAISSAGGVDFELGGKTAMIIRTENPLNNAGGQKVAITIDLDKLLRGADQISNLPLLDRDVIYIPKAEQFFIMGQVKTPGAYKFTEKDMSLVEAIGTAGGFTPLAARTRTRIIRVENGQEKIITVNVDAITGAGRKIQDVTIKPGDIIVVPESFF